MQIFDQTGKFIAGGRGFQAAERRIHRSQRHALPQADSEAGTVNPENGVRKRAILFGGDKDTAR